MKIKSLSLCSIAIVASSLPGMALAQRGITMTSLRFATGASCPLTSSHRVDLNVGTAFVLISDYQPAFMLYATSLFNPKEYNLSHGSALVTSDPSGRSAETTTLPEPESFKAILAGTTSMVGSPGRNRFSSSPTQIPVAGWMEDLPSFVQADSASMVRLPPALGPGTLVDPVGHVVCIFKTKTKSNQSNDRVSPPNLLPYVDAVSAQGIRISMSTVDGKGLQVITPSTMGAMKLTKADAGRTADASATGKKIQSWVKDCYDRRTMAYDPTLTNVLQFDISSTEAEKLKAQFHPGQNLRVKVKFPWLCDADCSMTAPLSQSWVEPVSSNMCRVSIVLPPDACRVLPTVNK